MGFILNLRERASGESPGSAAPQPGTMNLLPAVGLGLLVAILAWVLLPKTTFLGIAFLCLNAATLVMAVSFIGEPLFPRAFVDRNPLLIRFASIIALCAFGLAVVEAGSFGLRYTVALAATALLFCAGMVTTGWDDYFRVALSVVFLILFVSMSFTDALKGGSAALLYDSAVSVSLLWISVKYLLRILKRDS